MFGNLGEIAKSERKNCFDQRIRGVGFQSTEISSGNYDELKLTTILLYNFQYRPTVAFHFLHSWSHSQFDWDSEKNQQRGNDDFNFGSESGP